jgi:acetyl-CoA carboxylase biotin carboxyl carrier protein
MKMDDKTLLALFDKFDKSDAAELRYTGNGFSFELRRKDAFVAAAAPSAPSSGYPAGSSAPRAELQVSTTAPTAHTASPAPHAPAGGGGAAAPGFEYIKSPIVGTFYRAASPDTPAFSDVGKKIGKGQKLCIIEAMKMMNALEAEFDCEIVKILVNNGDMVEFDQPIFEVRPI